jgi:phosphohistidine phosphatase
VFIYFLRHASAGKHKMNQKQDDKRSLDKDGLRQCQYIGRALAALDVQVEAVLSSPLKRAAQTASLVANEMGHEGKIIFTDALGKEAEYPAFQELVRKYAKRDAIVVVGHNPSLSRFLSLTISAGANDRAVELKKGAVARVDSDGATGGSLDWCLTPKAVEVIHDAAIKSSRPKTSRK